MIDSVVVVGTGTMAPGIAAACARAGASVTVAGRQLERAVAASEKAGERVRAALIEEGTFSGCELVIETVVEDLEVKRGLLSRLEGWLDADALLATNTSSLPVASLASALQSPQRLAGLHFLHPAALTGVVEIVPGVTTSARTIELLIELAERMPKLPLVLRRDYPGFIWNRLQMAMLRECVHLLDEGVADLRTIDAAVADGLAPRWVAAGPLATSDLGGSATFRRVAEQLFGQLSSGGVSASLGPGFYRWTDESAKAVSDLRAETLRAGRAFATTRRDAYPEPA